MKWKTPVKQEVPVGSSYYCKVFAWLPKKAEDGYTYWLEKVYVEVKYFYSWTRARSDWYISKWIGNKAPEGEVDS